MASSRVVVDKRRDFPPPPGQLIAAVVGIAFWVVEQVLGLVPVEPVLRLPIYAAMGVVSLWALWPFVRRHR